MLCIWELMASGINVSDQAKKFASDVKRLMETSGAKRLMILGDVKHGVFGLSIGEMRKLSLFFEALP